MLQECFEACLSVCPKFGSQGTQATPPGPVLLREPPATGFPTGSPLLQAQTLVVSLPSSILYA